MVNLGQAAMLSGMGNEPVGLAPYERVAESLRKAITSGQLKPRAQLPSNRALAEQHGVSLPTLQRAVALLKDEGWLVSRGSVGVFVADPLPDPKPATLDDLHMNIAELQASVVALQKTVTKLEDRFSQVEASIRSTPPAE